MASLKEIYAENQDREYQVKLAAVTDSYEGDDVRIQLLDEAVDLVKQAQEKGTLAEDLHPSDILTLAVQIVEDEMSEQEKTAETVEEETETESSETGETEELSKEAAENVAAIGEVVGQILAERGVTVEDLEKIASEEEVEELGRYCAQVYAEMVADSEDA